MEHNRRLAVPHSESRKSTLEAPLPMQMFFVYLIACWQVSSDGDGETGQPLYLKVRLLEDLSQTKVVPFKFAFVSTAQKNTMTNHNHGTVGIPPPTHTHRL